MSPMSLEDLSKEELFSYAKELEEKLKRKTKYGLVWEDKLEDVVLECENKYPILKNIKERSIRNDKNSPVNVLIEGDNYHALQILQYTHKGKVDVIYIDPPYNTGNKDFIYNDSFVDGEDGYRHSKWLSFMERRLKLAKELLKDTGVIFISIDDNEQAQLKLLCDGVFGENNFVANVVIHSNPRGRQSSSDVAQTHEYLFIYKKTSLASLSGVDLTSDQISEYALSDNMGVYRLIGLRLRGGRATAVEAPTLHFPLFYNSKKDELNIFKKYDDDIEIIPKFSNGTLGTWRWSKKKIENDKKLLMVKKVNGIGGSRYDIFQKDYLTQEKSMKLKSMWDDKEINYDRASDEIKDIFDEKAFDYAKPVFLLKKIIKSASKDAVILDFFAGSGTTGHAVLELNKEDGGNRQFILVTNNGDEKSDHKIAEKITYERLKRVMNGYQNKKGEKIEGLGCNLDYLRCDFIDKILHEDNMRLNIAKNSKDTILFKEGASGVEKEEKVKNESIYTIVTNLHSSTTAIYQSIDDSHLDKFKKDLENMPGYKSVYLNPLISSEDYFKDLKDITIQEMPNIN